MDIYLIYTAISATLWNCIQIINLIQIWWCRELFWSGQKIHSRSEGSGRCRKNIFMIVHEFLKKEYIYDCPISLFANEFDTNPLLRSFHKLNFSKYSHMNHPALVQIKRWPFIFKWACFALLRHVQLEYLICKLFQTQTVFCSKTKMS